MYGYLFVDVLSWGLGIAALFFVLVEIGFFRWIHKSKLRWPKLAWVGLLVLVIAIVIKLKVDHPYPVNFAMPMFMHSQAPGGLPPSVPIKSAFQFLKNTDQFEKVVDIGADPTQVPAPINRQRSENVKISLTAQEVIGEVAPGIKFNYWTYNGQVPGPMLRVREGDTVELSLTNHPSSLHEHNIDLHSVTGPGGGAAVTKVKPGETKTFSWKALNSGLYVYHCATPNVSTHNSHGQYGLILVEPKEGLPSVDKEFYVMQGELYTQGGIGKKGLVIFDSQGLIDEHPTYITFNGRVESQPRMEVATGEKVRIYVGNGGVSLISSFHVIGEIFDEVYPEASMGTPTFKNIQTTAVLPGGAAIVEFTTEVPGSLVLVDHALARMNKGAWAVMKVTGETTPGVFESLDGVNWQGQH